MKPRLGLAATDILQDVPGAVSGFSSIYSQRHREQAQISGHHTLFTGLREYLAVRQAKAQTASAEFTLRRARQLLYQDVVSAYLDLLAVHHEMGIRQAILDTTDARIKELRQRERLGRSRRSELLAAESQRAQVAAQLDTARGTEALAQLKLRFLSGIEDDVAPAEVSPPAAEALDRYLEAARSRPDVEAARRSRDAAVYPVAIAARQRWPVVNLDGNYYLHRPPPQDMIKWDVSFSLSLPLYDGGITSAQVREAEAARRSAEAALTQALRQAGLDVRSAHRNLASALSVVAALEKAAELAAENARAQAEDYRLGLVTNLDVLGSISALQETRLALDQARTQAFFSRAQLDVAAGLAGGGS